LSRKKNPAFSEDIFADFSEIIMSFLRISYYNKQYRYIGFHYNLNLMNIIETCTSAQILIGAVMVLFSRASSPAGNRKLKKMKCWEIFGCEEKACPVHNTRNSKCWLFSGTHCHHGIQEMFLEKMEMCVHCKVFQANMSTSAMKETLKLIDKQFRNFKRLVKKRDKELEGVSMELALDISEIFEALRKISSGDPGVRISERSSIELLSRLKQMINSTAENIEEIVGQFHEVAIDLAEHFDVLNRVSKGDLRARIDGGSGVELMEALKKVTNHMIDSISGEMSERKKAEQQIQRNLKRIKALHAIDMAITSSLDVRLTLDVLLDQVTTQLGVHAADVLLLSPYSHTLEYAAGRGFHSVALQHTRLRIGDGHAGRSLLERRVINIPNLAEAPGDLARSPMLEVENFVAYYCVPLIAKGQTKGVLEIFNREPIDPDQDWMDFLETLASQGAIAIDNADLFQNMQRSNIELIRAYDDTLEGLSHALDLRDKETEGHTRRVAEMTLQIARSMDIGDEEFVNMRRGALLHDIGKIGIPDHILLKPGPLTPQEQKIMRKHPVFAYELLSPIAFLRPALDIPYCHHEKWDGTGYPRGLKGEGIPLPARIFAIVDVWDALNSTRPYRSAWPKNKIIAHIRDETGKSFDPKIAAVFLKLLNRGEI
jgi:putative methionine-R-sulfoxide reductase with GAF domain